jgi:lipid-A-disaccharide synthase-like uncharacterized protein
MTSCVAQNQAVPENYWTLSSLGCHPVSLRTKQFQKITVHSVLWDDILCRSEPSSSRKLLNTQFFGMSSYVAQNQAVPENYWTLSSLGCHSVSLRTKLFQKICSSWNCFTPSMKAPQPFETSTATFSTTQRNVAGCFTGNWILLVNVQGTRQVMYA